MTINGTGSQFSSTGILDVGRLGSSSGVLNIEAGGRAVTSGEVRVGDGFFATGVVNVTGTDANGDASTWEAGVVRIGYAGQGTLNVTAGGRVTTSSAAIGYFGGATGVVTVSGTASDGAASTWMNVGNLDVSDNLDGGTNGTLNINDGGLVSVGGATTIDLNGAVTLTDAGSTLSTFDLLVGWFGGPGSLNINAGTTVNVTGGTTILENSVVNLNGGRLEFGSMTTEGLGRITGVSGSLAGSLVAPLTGVNDIATLADADLQSVGFRFDRTLFPNLADEVDTSEVVGGGNSGYLFGAGVSSYGLINNTDGEIEVITGERMRFDGASNTNAGQVTLAGGQVQFTQGFTNQASGLVIGDGGLRADGGTVNDGTMAFSATSRVIGDLVNEATGLITSSGGTTTFFDDVINNGEVRTFANSFTVFFGAVSGPGSYTETGTVIFAGSFSPGSSPAEVAFGGDVGLTDDADLLIELAGDAEGEFDSLTVDGRVTLDGELSVSLLDGYTPALGDSFDVLTAASIAGVFDSVTLPAASFELIYSATAVRLIATSALSGDYNNDGSVNAADYTVWRDSLGSPAGTLLNDTAGGVVGSAQYESWRANFGATLPASSAAVPEPSGVVLLFGGLALLLAQSRGAIGGKPLAGTFGLAIAGISPLAHADLVTGAGSLRD